MDAGIYWHVSFAVIFVGPKTRAARFFAALFPAKIAMRAKPAFARADSLKRCGQNEVVDERWENMRKWITAAVLAGLLFLSTTARAQNVQEADAMLRAFERAQLYAQGFEVTYCVTRSPSAAVPLLEKGSEAAAQLPYGSFTTREEKQATTLYLRCRVAPDKEAARQAASRMRRLLGLRGETTLVLYGTAADGEKTAYDARLRTLLESLGDSVRATRYTEGKLLLAGAAYQVRAVTQEERVQFAIARPRFETDSETGERT